MKLCVTIKNLSDAIRNFIMLLLGFLHDIQELLSDLWTSMSDVMRFVLV
jgi:hypothetical protein